MSDNIRVELTEDEIKEILSTLPKTGISAKLEALLAKKEYRDTHPHKLMDEYEAMRACPYRDDWHYCCRCDFEYICTGSDNYDKNMVKKHIEENWGK